MNTFLKWLFRILRLARMVKEQKKRACLELAPLACRNSSESIAIINTRHEIMAVNPAFERTTGYRESVVIGKNAALLDSGRHAPAFYEAMWQVIYSTEFTEFWQGEVWLKRKNRQV